jgi:tetratricopeptide (TPR) repeat protein
MGVPLDGQPFIPNNSLAPQPSRLRQQAAEARASGHTATELATLLRLDSVTVLRSDERSRLVSLLERRVAQWAALGRPIPRALDLRRIDEILAETPGRALSSLAAGPRAARADAERAAGDAWLAIGDRERARDCYQAATHFGAAPSTMSFRLFAAEGRAPAGDTPLVGLEEAIGSLPGPASLPFVQTYLNRGGDDHVTLRIAWSVAHEAGRSTLAARIASRTRGTAGTAEAADTADIADAPPEQKRHVPPAFFEACADPCRWGTWLEGGVTYAARMPSPNARQYLSTHAATTTARRLAAALVEEDPSSAEVRELAASIDAQRGNWDAAEQHLVEMIYFTPARGEGLERAARFWEQFGQARRACATWHRLAVLRDDPTADAWQRVWVCARRDPGIADAAAIRRYLLARVPAAQRAQLETALDQADPLRTATLRSTR